MGREAAPHEVRRAAAGGEEGARGQQVDPEERGPGGPRGAEPPRARRRPPSPYPPRCGCGLRLGGCGETGVAVGRGAGIRGVHGAGRGDGGGPLECVCARTKAGGDRRRGLAGQGRMCGSHGRTGRPGGGAERVWKTA